MKKLVGSSRISELGHSIEFIFDMNPEMWGTEYDGVRIISPFQAVKEYKTGNVDKIVLPAATTAHLYIDKYIDEQVRFGVKKEDLLFSTVELYNEEEGEEFLGIDKYGYLDYLEFHTNDHCNLNCKHCNNYSNLVDHEVFTDFEKFKKDIYRLKDIVSHIHLIRILGGEPLLNKELHNYVSFLRDELKFSEIRIVTNALLLKSLDDKLVQTMIECDALFEISAYPVMYNKLDEIDAFLKEKGIKHKIGWIANSFLPPLFKEEYGYPLEKVDCVCIHLRDGKIARCPLVQYLDYYNAAHGTSYDGSDGIIDIYDESITPVTLWERLGKSFDLCNRCGFWRKDLPGQPWCQDGH